MESGAFLNTVDIIPAVKITLSTAARHGIVTLNFNKMGYTTGRMIDQCGESDSPLCGFRHLLIFSLDKTKSVLRPFLRAAE